MRRHALLALVAIFSFGFISAANAQTSYSWNTSGSGSWLTSSNWTGGASYPGSTSGTYDSATFGIDPVGGYTVSIASGSTVYINTISFTQTDTTAANSYTITGGTINLGGTSPNAIPTFNVATAGVSATIASALTGSSGLNITGSGTLILTSASNSFTGGVGVSGGALQISSAANLPSANALTLSGGALYMTGSMTLGNNVTIASGQSGTLKMVGAKTGTLSGNYAGVAGTLTLDESGGTGYTGFTITSTSGPSTGAIVNILGATGTGNVQVGDNASLATQAFFANAVVNVTATGSGVTYLAYGNNVGSPTAQFGALNGGNASTLIAFDNRTGIVTINGVANGNFAGTIGNGAGGVGPAQLIKNGAGTQILSGANTYTGATTINGGVLQVASAEKPGTSGPLGNLAATAAGTIVFGGGTLQYSTANQFDYSGRFSTAASQLYSIDTNGQQVTFATGLASSGGSLTLMDSAGGGKLTLTGASTYSGNTTITSGTLQIGGAGSLGSANYSGNIANNGTLQYSSTATQAFSGSISGSGSLIKDTSTSVLVLSGSNSYTGTTTVNAGILSVTGTLAGGVSLGATPPSLETATT